MQNEKLARGPHVSFGNDYGQPYGNAYKPNLRQFGNDDGPGFNGNESLECVAGNG